MSNEPAKASNNGQRRVRADHGTKFVCTEVGNNNEFRMQLNFQDKTFV